ncbi:MAG: isopentenyl phosphate kinase family protein [Candidatus Lokiarchaeota archaeon]|nr:isopentenyl phosphate kinase family protein [Candidatus Lokiarchaeota archaeon]
MSTYLKNLTILKLGGSVITDKSKQNHINMQTIQRIAEEVSTATSTISLLLVHGGGSFGHPIAKKYQIHKGWYSPEQKIGFSETRRAMMTLNKTVIDIFLAEGIPVVSVQPSACTLTNSGRITHMDLEPTRSLLKFGFVPVLFGDAVMDISQGIAILSGDQIVTYLAKELAVKKVIFGTNVDGLLNSDNEVIPEINHQNFKTLLKLAKESVASDVTGGMFGKLQEIEPLTKEGIEVIIVNAKKPGIIEEVLKGRKVVGTYFTGK